MQPRRFDADGFDADGFSRIGRDRQGFDRDGFDSGGFDRVGRDRHGFDRTRIDPAGFRESSASGPMSGRERRKEKYRIERAKLEAMSLAERAQVEQTVLLKRLVMTVSMAILYWIVWYPMGLGRL